MAPEDWTTITKVTAPEGLRDVVERLTQSYSKHRVPRFLSRCHRIIESLRPFMAAVDVFVQVDQGIACLVWGSIRVVLEVKSVFPALVGTEESDYMNTITYRLCLSLIVSQRRSPKCLKTAVSDFLRIRNTWISSQWPRTWRGH